jgi:hypothetical protein
MVVRLVLGAASCSLAADFPDDQCSIFNAQGGIDGIDARLCFAPVGPAIAASWSPGSVFLAKLQDLETGKEVDVIIKKATEYGEAEAWMNERLSRAAPACVAEYITAFMESSVSADDEATGSGLLFGLLEDKTKKKKKKVLLATFSFINEHAAPLALLQCYNSTVCYNCRFPRTSGSYGSTKDPTHSILS